MNSNKLLGEKIKVLRNIKQLTQKEMAEKLNISEQKYVNIENGLNNISLEILIPISNILNVSINDIISVLDNEVEIMCPNNENSVKKIMNMLDLFYVNKNLYLKLQKNT